eukprot:TRINITY_DN111310_c0_g1_i1.p1 TRINITY_DN111310_c0_g1~~TRINITY_DN111310_c0_g1_i1.p1  ORF type:complete len:292 (-),score=55.92 TRINITY_DN111310_c0_g1_i1:216-1091(-)
MGNSIHKVDDGLWICGVDGLADYSRLDSLGIRCILNAANLDLYREHGDITSRFDVKIIGADDHESCDLSPHFEEIAEFIEQGRGKGGVVVHCAAGISRACTSVMSYLMQRHDWDVPSAFKLVQARRPFVSPNRGFWRQLLSLQAALEVKRGEPLKSLPDDWVPPAMEQPGVEQDLTIAQFNAKPAGATIDALNRESRRISPQVRHYLTARLTPAPECSVEDVASGLQETTLVGVTWENMGLHISEGHLLLRAGLSASWDGATLLKALSALRFVGSAVVESASTAQARATPD